MNCDYCFAGTKEDGERMSFHVVRKAIDFLINESRDKEDLSILFFGGEPFLEFDLIKKAVKYCESLCVIHNKKITFNITTNGITFTKESLEFCRNKKIKVLLSIDGDRESQDKHRKTKSGGGTFDLLMKVIPELKTFQPWLGARVTIHPDLAHRLFMNIRFLMSKGINQFILSPVEGVEWPKDALRSYEDELMKIMLAYTHEKNNGVPVKISLFEEFSDDKFMKKKTMWGCRAGRYSITVLPNGDIIPCSKFIWQDDLKTSSKFGNIEEGLTNVFLRLGLNGYRIEDREYCLKCDYSQFCMGGCYALNYKDTGNMYHPSQHTCTFTAITNRLFLKYESTIQKSQD